MRPPKDNLRRPVISGTNVLDVGFSTHQPLATAKVTQLDGKGLVVDEQVVWLDVSVANILCMQVFQCPKELKHAQLHTQVKYTHCFLLNTCMVVREMCSLRFS